VVVGTIRELVQMMFLSRSKHLFWLTLLSASACVFGGGDAFGQAFFRIEKPVPSQDIWLLTTYIGLHITGATKVTNKSAPSRQPVILQSEKFTEKYIDTFLKAVVSSYIRDGVLDPLNDAKKIQDLLSKERPNQKTSQDILFAVLKVNPLEQSLTPDDFLATLRVAGPDLVTGKLPMQADSNFMVQVPYLWDESGYDYYRNSVYTRMGISSVPAGTKVFDGGYFELKNFSRPAAIHAPEPGSDFDAPGWVLERAIEELKFGDLPIFIPSDVVLTVKDDATQEVRHVNGPAILRPRTVVAEAANLKVAKNLGLNVLGIMNGGDASESKPLHFAWGFISDLFQAGVIRNRHLDEEIFTRQAEFCKSALSFDGTHLKPSSD